MDIEVKLLGSHGRQLDGLGAMLNMSRMLGESDDYYRSRMLVTLQAGDVRKAEEWLRVKAGKVESIEDWVVQ